MKFFEMELGLRKARMARLARIEKRLWARIAASCKTDHAGGYGLLYGRWAEIATALEYATNDVAELKGIAQ